MPSACRPRARPTHRPTDRHYPLPPTDATQSANEHIRTVWSTANCLGIRSRPDALSPDFRTRLFEELVSATKRERAATGRRKPDLSYGLEGGPLSMPLSVGQKQVARIHPLAGVSVDGARGAAQRGAQQGRAWRAGS
jgi:hypothetical protein